MSVLIPIGGAVILKRVTAAVALAGSTPTADAGLTLDIISPADATTTIANGSLTAAATGVYWYTHKPAAAGLWRYRWKSTTYGDTEETVEVVSVIAET